MKLVDECRPAVIKAIQELDVALTLRSGHPDVPEKQDFLMRIIEHYVETQEMSVDQMHWIASLCYEYKIPCPGAYEIFEQYHDVVKNHSQGMGQIKIAGKHRFRPI